MGKFGSIVLISIFFFFTFSSYGDETHDIYQQFGEVGKPVIQSHQLKSIWLKQRKEVLVSLPHSYLEAKARQQYPLIFVLDAEFLFYSIAGQIHFQGLNSQMPEAIVVGLPNQFGTRRDMTPTPFGRDGQPLWFGGKQDEYLEFMQSELLPFIKRHYSVADYSVLIGLSPTGQFALHSLWKAPTLFDAHVAMNTADFTAVGYDGQSALEKLIEVLRLDKQHKGRLYISMPKSGGGSNPKVLNGYNKFDVAVNALGNPNFEHKIELIERDSYAAVLPAVTSALAFIFPPSKWDPDYGQFLSDEPGKTLGNIKNYFSQLSLEYGFEAFPKGERFYNRQRLKRLGYVMLQNNRTQEAIDIFDYWRSLYPNSANAHDSLADAYLQHGNDQKAKELRTKAYTLAIKNKDFRQAIFELH